MEPLRSTAPAGVNGVRGFGAVAAYFSRRTSVLFTRRRTIPRCAAAFHGPTPRPGDPTSTTGRSAPNSCSSRSWCRYNERERKQSVARISRSGYHMNPRPLLTSPLLLLTFFMPPSAAAQSKDRALEHARKLLESTPLV